MFTSQELLQCTGGELLSPANDFPIESVFTDTRQDGRGKLFVALKGERFDAHDFLAKAVDCGSAALCIEKAKREKLPGNVSIPVLLVEDTLRAYQSIGALQRKRFPLPAVAGVTGSVGKTSVKEILRAILEEAYPERVIYTIGNTNNQIGVVQNLLRFDENTRAAVLEAGTSAPGEIEPLSRIIAPNCALVNSIAPCHLEKLRDLNGVAEEKSHIFDGLPAGGGAVIPAECAGHDILYAKAKKFRLLQFGSTAKADVRAVYEGGNLDGSSFRLTFPSGKTYCISWSLSGSHQACNAAAAAAAALLLGIDEETIVRGLPHATLPGMRLKRTVFQGATYVNDAYNANPASMLASIDWLGDFADEKKLVFVLGEMRELGSNSKLQHDRVLAYAKEKFPHARYVLIGKEFDGFPDSETAAQAVRETVRPGDLVFAKGSRGTAVEKALPPEVR